MRSPLPQTVASKPLGSMVMQRHNRADAHRYAAPPRRIIPDTPNEVKHYNGLTFQNLFILGSSERCTTNTASPKEDAEQGRLNGLRRPSKRCRKPSAGSACSPPARPHPCYATLISEERTPREIVTARPVKSTRSPLTSTLILPPRSEAWYPLNGFLPSFGVQ